MMHRATRKATSSRNERGGIFAHLARDESGVTIIEFAFIVGPLFALIIAILQVSLTFFAQQNLETTTAIVTRQLMTGSAQSAGMTQAGFLQAVCNQLPFFMRNCANVMVDVQSTTSFSSSNTNTPTLTYNAQGNVTNTWAYSPGGAGQITTVKVMYIWATNRGPLGFDISTMSGGNRLLIATTVFKTEPSGS